MRKALIIVFLMLALSFLIDAKFLDYGVFPIHGNWRNNDQSLVIPASYLASGSGLFAKDFAINEYLSVYPSAIFKTLGLFYTIFGDMLAGYLSLLLALKAIFIFSTFFLSERILGDEKKALLATFALSLTHFMGVEEIGISEVVAKSFAFAFFPALVYFLLKGNTKTVFATLGIMAYFHVLSAIPLFLALSAYLLNEKRKGAIVPISIFVVIFLPFLYGNMISEKPDIAFLKETAPYSSAVNGIAPILKYVPLLTIGLWGMKKHKLSLVAIAALAYSLISVLSLFSDALIPYSFFRAAKFAIYLSFIFFIPVIWTLTKNKYARFGAMALLIVPFSSIHYSNILFKNDLETQDIMKIGEWVRENSEANDIIAIPPQWPSLRGWSQRSVVITENDLWIGAIKPSAKGEILKRYNAKSHAELEGYGAKYVIAYKDQLDTKLLFESGNFRVYE